MPFKRQLNATMKAAWYKKQGAPSEVPVVGEVPTPDPGKGEVRIEGRKVSGWVVVNP